MSVEGVIPLSEDSAACYKPRQKEFSLESHRHMLRSSWPISEKADVIQMEDPGVQHRFPRAMMFRRQLYGNVGIG